MNRSAEQLFELGMRLKGLDKFFILENLPISAYWRKRISSKNFVSEICVLKAATIRINSLLSEILGEKQENSFRFARYIEHHLVQTAEWGSYCEQWKPLESMVDRFHGLLEIMNNFGVLLRELSRLKWITYTAFQAMGQIFARELKQTKGIEFLLKNDFRAQYDTVRNKTIVQLVRGIKDPSICRPTARILLELFRLLHYLQFIDLETKKSSRDRRKALLIFSLVNSEARGLLRYINSRCLPQLDSDDPLHSTLEFIHFTNSMELRKVFEKELVDIVALEKEFSILIRLQNSHGILKENFQQSVVHLAQAFDPLVKGHDIFEHYVTRLEQTKKLQAGLYTLFDAIDAFQEGGPRQTLIQHLDEFQQHQLIHLMYKDWEEFERLIYKVTHERQRSRLELVVKNLDAFVKTLIQEVGKRSLLAEKSSNEDHNILIFEASSDKTLEL